MAPLPPLPLIMQLPKHFATERTTIRLSVDVLCLANRQSASAVLSREVMGLKGLPWFLVLLVLLLVLLEER